MGMRRVEIFTHVLDRRFGSYQQFDEFDLGDSAEIVSWLEDRSIEVSIDTSVDHATARTIHRYHAWMDEQAWTEFQLTWR